MHVHRSGKVVEAIIIIAEAETLMCTHSRDERVRSGETGIALLID